MDLNGLLRRPVFESFHLSLAEILAIGTIIFLFFLGIDKYNVNSVEVGYSSFSPRGASGGAIIPASCESGIGHFLNDCLPPPPYPVVTLVATTLNGGTSGSAFYNEVATITWSSTNSPTSCTIYQNGIAVGTYAYPAITSTTTIPIIADTVYRVDCVR